MDAHFKNVEASSTDGKFDPSAGLAQVCVHFLFLSLIFLCGLDMQGLIPGGNKLILIAVLSKLVRCFLFKTLGLHHLRP